MIFGEESSVLLTGTDGMVGSAVKRQLNNCSDIKLLTPPKQELDLCDRQQVDAYFDQHRPDYVLMIGAKVGGIIANKTDPVGFLSENTRMQLNPLS